MVDIDLGGHRHTMQGAERIAPGAGCVAGVGGGKRLVIHPAHDCVELAVHGVHPRQARRHRLAAGHLAKSYPPREVACVKLPKLHSDSAF